MAINDFDTSRPGFFNLRTLGPNYLWVNSPQMSVRVPAESPDVLAAGAVYWGNGQLEDFSSRGPVFGPGGAATGGAMKPDLTAADGVSTATYSPGAFYGTSAAAPHAAGAAVALMSKSYDMNAYKLKEALMHTARDAGDPGADNEYGAGIMDLAAALDWITAKPVPALSVAGLLLSILSLGFLSAFSMRRKRRMNGE